MHYLYKFTTVALAGFACLLVSACATVPDAPTDPAAPQAPTPDLTVVIRAQMISALRTSPFLSVSEKEDATILVQIRSADAFARARATPSDDLKAALHHVTRVMRDHEGYIVRAVGHTDTSGSAARNVELSTARAKAASRQMIQAGLDPSRVQYEGRGQTEPIASNDTREGRAVNRRVDILILPAQ